VGRETVKAFVLEQAAWLKTHALDWCSRTGCPYQYLGNIVRKEEMTCKIAERDGIKQGLVFVLSLVELRWVCAIPRLPPNFSED
jgi:hypothetical protein